MNNTNPSDLQHGLSQSFPKSLFIVAEPSMPLSKRQGAHSDVYVGTYCGVSVAMKLLHSRPRDPKGRNAVENRLFSECLKWKQLQHANILPLLGVDLESVHHTPTLILPWTERGNIRDHIDKLSSKPSTEELITWLLGIARGVNYLHQSGIAHGDLRGNNILISDDGIVQVTDIGLSSFREEQTMLSPRRKGGPERWMAPEYLDSSEPTYATDSFAFGFVCIELFTGRIPYPELSDNSAIDRTDQGDMPERPDTITEPIWTLVKSCWNRLPGERPTMQTIVDVILSVQ